MNYIQHYNNLIDRAKYRNLEIYKEQHHILPICIGGTNHKDNLVYLTPEEHLIAHLLLIKIYNDPKLIYAAKWMTNRVKNNKEYGWLRKKHSEIMSNRIISNETKQKMSIAQKNRPKDVQDRITYAQQNRSPETRKNMSDAHMGHIVSDETKEKIRNANIGRRHTEETKQKMSASRSGEKNHSFGKSPTQETRLKMKESAKNRPPQSAETKRKKSEKLKGRIMSTETKQKMRDAANKRYHKE